MGRTRSTNRGLILLLQIMTPYIQQQLKKLCDNPNWYDDMLISWDKNPRNQREAIYHIIRIILSVGTILTLIRNEKIYQAHKHTHPTNKIRYIISQLIILTLYTSSLILVSYTYRIILRYI
jgi:hypothetical protein